MTVSTSGTAISWPSFDASSRTPPGQRRRDLRSPSRHRRPPGVGAADPDRPRPEARAAGRGRHRPDPGGAVRPGPGQRDGRGVRARGPRGRARMPAWWWWGRTSTSATAAAGNVGLLTEMGARYGFDVVGMTLEEDGSAPCGVLHTHPRVPGRRRGRRLPPSSSAVPTRSGASVEHGDGRGGSELDFPTANVAVPEGIAMPGEGIYACWYERPDGSVHGAAASSGAPAHLPRLGRRARARGVPVRLRPATSTVSRPGSRSWPICVRNVVSTPPRHWSHR